MKFQPTGHLGRHMSRKILVAAVVAMSGFAMTACSASLSAQTGNDIAGTSITNTSDVVDSDAAVTNVDKKGQLKAGDRIKITAQDPWVIETIALNGTEGDSVQGVPAPGMQWKSGPLNPQSLTTMTATMRNPTTGQTLDITRKVMAGPAQDTFSAEISPDKGTYGVGIIPKVTFDKEVPTSSRQDIESRLQVSASPTPVQGAWRWLDSTTVAYRPNGFWPGHDKVTITANLTNARIPGGSGENDAWGKGKVTGGFSTGRAMIINLNGKTDQGYATIDGKKVRTFPISLGKAGYTTRSGIKTLTEKYRYQRMTNQGVTDEEVYDLQVPYAMRMTDTGEFLHAAPWNGNIGYANTSHGCSNLTMEDAEWFYNRMLYGDPVVTTGTDRPMESWNGPGGLWNIKFKQWAN